MEPAPSAGICPENVSLTTYAGALNGAPAEGMEMCNPEASWLRVGRLVYVPAVAPSNWTEVSVPRLIRSELSVVMFIVLPGQPSTVAYNTVLSLLRVNRISVLVPARGVVNEPP